MRHFLSCGIGSLTYNAYMMSSNGDDRYIYAFGCVFGVLLVGVILTYLEPKKETKDGPVAKS